MLLCQETFPSILENSDVPNKGTAFGGVIYAKLIGQSLCEHQSGQPAHQGSTAGARTIRSRDKEGFPQLQNVRLCKSHCLPLLTLSITEFLDYF